MLKQIIQEEIAIFAIERNDEYYEAMLFSNSLNESVGWGDITSLIKNIVDKKKTFLTALTKFNTSTNSAMKRSLLMVMLAIISFNAGSEDTLARSIDPQTLHNLATKPQLTQEELLDVFHEKKNVEMSNAIDSLTISDSGKEFIKKHESLRLKPYKLGDGMITIGYGHAERANTSWFKNRMDHTITPEIAEKLFQNDIEKTEAGLKRILHRLRNKGVIFDLTQNMYDAMVSMTFNMGVAGFESSPFIQSLKQTKNPMKSAELIKTSRIGNFKGLPVRRGEEHDLFTSHLTDS